MIQVPLVGKRGTGLVTLVDEQDVALVDLNWWLHSDDYAYRKSDGQTILMHRMIMGLAAGDRREVDHRNGDRLDNRRTNLRVCTRAQNAQNRIGARGSTSRHRGVSWCSRRRKWVAELKLGGKAIVVGSTFTDEDEAAAAVAEARREFMPYSERN